MRSGAGAAGFESHCGMKGVGDGLPWTPVGMISGWLRREQKGMTIVEIAVVLAVVGLLLALGLPSLKGWQAGIDLRNAAARISDAMLESRTKSIVERQNYTVSVDYTTDAYTVAPTGGTARLSGSVDMYPDNSDPDCPSLSAQNIVFRPNSTADAAGFEAVHLKSKGASVQVRYRVKVLGATAKVSVEKWVGGAWIGAY